jgi:glycosyltransferase involved in cell wall biosynthesis
VANILFNALASTAGGGLTYLRNVLPRLKQQGRNHHFVVLLPEERYDEFSIWQNESLTMDKPLRTTGLVKRLWWEQTALKKILRQRQINALVSLGNFAMIGPAIPQILFSRNALYFSTYFMKDLRRRRAWPMLAGHLLKSCLAKWSLRIADYHVTPSAAMAEYLQAEGVKPERLKVLPFGFDSSIFIGQRKPLAANKAAALAKKPDAIKLLYVSHYNYFRNFETLLRALPLLKARFERPVQLVLTTELKPGAVYGGYHTDAAFALIEQLKLTDDVLMLGTVNYDQLSWVYQACDVFVCPSYAESFGHPLLEAMSAKLPVVAANLPVHREICGDAAVYFDVFDEGQLASQVTQVLRDATMREHLAAAGEKRIQQFSWDAHVAGLMEFVETIAVAKKPKDE